jgi:hypothetical protein
MTLSPLLVPSSGVLFGNYPGSGGAGSCDSSSTNGAVLFRNFETLVERTPTTNGILDVAHFYHDWNDFVTTFPTTNEDALVAEGRLLFVNWTPRIYGTSTIFQWADIAAGIYDATYVDPTARKMRDWGQKFFIGFHSECNSGSSAQGGAYGTDAEYASAAQHVHDRFIAQGCTNAVWVFNPSGHMDMISRMSTLYPGDAYVDWIGYDPYGNSGQDLTYVMDTKYPVYNWATVTKSGSHTKPLMWIEWGDTESATGTSKATYFGQVQSQLTVSYPLVKAIVYFNSPTSTGDCVNTSTAAVNAFRLLAADPSFNTDVSPQPPPPPGTIALRGTASAAINKAKTVGVPVPATAQAGDGLAVFLGVTRSALRNSCEGTNATNMTVANSNSNGSNPVQVVTATAPVYDTSQKHSGSSSWHCSLTAGTDCHGDITTNFGSPSTYYGRIYFRKSASPAAICRMFHQNSAANAVQWGIGLDTSGNLIVRDNAAAVTRLTMSTTITTNTWHRVEWKAVWTGAQTTVTVRLYLDALASETTLDEEKTSTTFAQAAAPGNYKFGLIFSAANTYDLYVDDFGLDTTDWLGPAGTAAAITAPGSLVQLGTDTNVAGSIELLTQVYRKTVASGDPGSTLTFTTDVEVHGSVVLVCWSGTDQSALEDVIATPAQRQSSATTITTPTTPTTTVAGDWIISVAFDRAQAGSAANTSWTVASETVRASAFGTGTDGRVSGAVSDDGIGHSIATYGGRVATAVATSFLASAWTLAIRPTAAGTATQYVGVLVHQL